MKQIALIFFLVVALVAESYRVWVTRVSDQMYQTGDVYIKTRGCYEYVTDDKATLIYTEANDYRNKLIFSSGRSCEVERIVR